MYVARATLTYLLGSGQPASQDKSMLWYRGGFKPWLYQLLLMRPWAYYLIPLKPPFPLL